MKNIQLLLFLSVLLISCKKSDNSIITVDLSKKDFQEVSLRSNDFVKDWRVVKLETNENSLVTPYDYIYPTDSFIIIYNYNKLLQFDYSGRFIRELAKYGESPYDINDIENCIVDSKQEYIYLIEFSKPNSIRVYDLKDNSFKDPIPLASEKRLTSMSLINDSTFLCFPYMGINRQLCYLQDFFGNFIDRNEKSDIKDDGPYTGIRLKVFTFDGEWFYQGNYEDTIYNALSKEPVAVFSKGNSPNSKDAILLRGKEDLIYINGIFCTSKDYMLSRINYEVRPTSEGGAYERHSKEHRYYVFDWKDKAACEVKSIYIEPFDKSFEKDALIDIFNKTSSLNHNKVVISIPDDENDDNPTLYIGDLF